MSNIILLSYWKYLKTLNSTDFFFLHGIARNVDSSTLKQVLQALAQAQEEGAGEREKGVEGTTSTMSPYDLLAGKDDMQDLIDKELAGDLQLTQLTDNK